jgi:photosystem II stability/assembly factor-like uncharacterized protein
MDMSRSPFRAFLLGGIFACAGIAATAANATTNQWTPIGPIGATISSIVSVDATIYAGTYVTGVLKSADGGATWRVASDGLTDPAVRALAVDRQTPSTVYAGTASGLFKSVDGASHWVPAGFQDVAHRSVNAIAVDSTMPQVVYAATSAGLYRSLDGAQSWSAIGFGTFVSNDVAVDPGSPGVVYFSGTDAAGGGSGVYRSVDAGATWTRIRAAPVDFDFDVFISPGRVYVDPGGSGRIYVTFGGDGVVTSQDAGATWSTLPVPVAVIPGLAAFAVDVANANTLYLGTSDGKLLRSADGGQSWTDTSATLQAGGVGIVASIRGTVFVGATNGRFFESTDAGATWKAADLGVRRVSAGPLVVDATAPSTIYTSADGVLLKTVDAGATWTSIGATLGYVSALALDPRSPSTLYAGAWSYAGPPTLFKSADAGTHWSPILANQVRQPVSTIEVAGDRDSTIYVSVQDVGILRSADAGSSGVFVNGDLGNPDAIAIDPSNADVVYAGSYTGRSSDGVRNVYKSLDGGAHWQPITIPTPVGTVVSRIAIDPNATSILYATLIGDRSQTLVYKSIDGGATWFPIVSGLPSKASMAAIAVDPSNPQRVYVGGSTGVYRSSDAGGTWAPLDAGQPMRDVRDLALDPSGKVLRASSGSGLFEYRFAIDSPDIVAVVEYYNSGFDHYFMTSNADEIASLDNGVIAGWTRTGLAFNAFAKAVNATVPVCRFFSTAFAPKSSHFYSPFDAECTKVRGDAHWQLETSDAFDIAVPSATGTCASGSAPVYRLYNNGQGGAPNHRYTTDQGVRAQMIAKGWVPEGIGPDAVQMCAPQ